MWYLENTEDTWYTANTKYTWYTGDTKDIENAARLEGRPRGCIT